MTLATRRDVIRMTLPLCLFLTTTTNRVQAHEGHQGTTYQVTEPWQTNDPGSHLRLRIVDTAGDAIAARFSLTIDGTAYVPAKLGPNGLRFVSIHTGKRNTFVATYSRGAGEIILPLPAGRIGTVTAARGFEFRSATASFPIVEKSASACTVVLERWTNLEMQGWQATDEHVHYERTDPEFDRDWLTMLDADGLSHAHFLVLKGGNVPGIWADQYAHGSEGEARRKNQFIRSGEEYRDSAQGHINLLGIDRVIQPISTGGIGQSPRHNHPPLADVLRETRRRGGIGGPAHGGALARSSTAILDTVLGAVDFFEIANSHLYKTDVWYRLLNAGFLVPPVAGTDLPNFGFRDTWQPLFGEVRTYVRMGKGRGFDAWVDSVKRGEVFITSGPLLSFTVNGEPAGSVIQLPKEGGTLDVLAELHSPRELHSLEVVQMGRPVDAQPVRAREEGITTLRLSTKLTVTKSCWLAARGTGGPKTAIEQGLGIEQPEIAHSGVIGVLVGDEPIGRTADLDELRQSLVEQQEYYRSEGRYESAENRRYMLGLFDQAIAKLGD